MSDASPQLQLEYAAAEAMAAFWEHEAYLLVGGHSPDRLKKAMDELARSLERLRAPAQGQKAA